MEDLQILGRYERVIHNNQDLIYNPTLKGNSLKNGEVLYVNDHIKFVKVPIFTPSGDVIIDEITMRIKEGMNTVIIGPNGSGKTAILRILAGLWPFFKGTIHKVSPEKILILPQISYLPKGTLRDLIIYPDIS